MEVGLEPEVCARDSRINSEQLHGEGNEPRIRA